ncbi:DUF2101 family protein [Amedibacillus sp. YH-ame10]
MHNPLNLYYNEKESEVTHMETIIYLLVVCFIIFLVISLLPIILPIVLIIVIALTLYILYIRRKFMKRMNEYDEDTTRVFRDTTYESYGNQKPNDDVIDVEYTESEDNR